MHNRILIAKHGPRRRVSEHTIAANDSRNENGRSASEAAKSISDGSELMLRLK